MNYNCLKDEIINKYFTKENFFKTRYCIFNDKYRIKNKHLQIYRCAFGGGGCGVEGEWFNGGWEEFNKSLKIYLDQRQKDFSQLDWSFLRGKE